MKQTIITFPSGNTTIQLEPSDGYKYISNNTIWSNVVALGKNDNIENWHDTNDEPPEPEEEAEITDYQNSLEKLGVEVND